MLSGSFSQGAGYLSTGFRLIRQPGLRIWVITPLVLNVLLFVFLFLALFQGVEMLIAWVMGLLPDWAWLQPLEWIFWLLYGGVVILLLAYGFVAVANLVGSPFYAILSEKVEVHLGGGKPAEIEGWKALLAEIPRVIGRELQKLAYYLPRALLLFIIGLIPVVNLVGALLWFLFNSWMMAMQYVDYPADNHRMPLKDLRALLGRERLTAMGFGVPVALLAMLPLVNLVLVPAAVCGGTAYWVAARKTENGL